MHNFYLLGLTFDDWLCRLGNSDNLLLTIQEKIKWADSMSEVDRRHKKEVEDKAEEMRKTIKVSDILISLK
jgi:COP9 signalosome complex subunit 7